MAWIYNAERSCTNSNCDISSSSAAPFDETSASPKAASSLWLDPVARPTYTMDLYASEAGVDDDLAELVDFDAQPEQVLDRIEQCVAAFLEELSFGRLQSIHTVAVMNKGLSTEQLAKVPAPAGVKVQQQCLHAG